MRRFGGGPVPASIVNMPPAARDGWLDAERPAIEERSRRGGAMFHEDHDGSVGRRMTERGAEQHDISPHVDTSGVDGLDHKLTEAAGHMDALRGKSITPTISAGSIDAYIVKLKQAAALEASLGKIGGGGTSGSVGTSYAVTAPMGRQGGPR